MAVSVGPDRHISLRFGSRPGAFAHAISSCSHSEHSPVARALSHQATSTSRSTSKGHLFEPGLTTLGRCKSNHNHSRKRVVVRALFEPPPFQPSKLSISFASGASPLSPAPPDSRKYTLTHNDITGQLWLTVGADFNEAQISGFYTRLLRDEVTAEWKCDALSGQPSLHVFCHVSGEEKWLAPPVLRNYIFRREMPLVLDCVLYAEQELLKQDPRLASAKVYIHFESSLLALNSIECWGILGVRSTWQAVPVSILKRLLYGMMRLPLEDLAPSDLHKQLPLADGLHSEFLPASHSHVVAAASLDILDLPAATESVQREQQEEGQQEQADAAASHHQQQSQQQHGEQERCCTQQAGTSSSICAASSNEDVLPASTCSSSLQGEQGQATGDTHSDGNGITCSSNGAYEISRLASPCAECLEIQTSNGAANGTHGFARHLTQPRTQLVASRQ